MGQLWTAQFGYPGPYRMDITHATTDRLGMYFAPTKEMVTKYKYSNVPEPEARKIYEFEYATLMLSRLPEMVSLGIWEELKAIPYIVMVCYCNANVFCHRHLAKDLMVSKGVEYIGEFTDFAHFRKPQKPVINNFHGINSWASNFAHSPFKIGGVLYDTNEHYFQSKKVDVKDPAASYVPVADIMELLGMNEHDALGVKMWEYIAKSKTPGKTKRLGKKVKLVWNWDGIRDEVMFDGLMAKFNQNEYHANKLRASVGFDLVEGNTWHDNYWGDCSCPKCSHIVGKNKLGTMLMQIRDNI